MLDNRKGTSSVKQYLLKSSLLARVFKSIQISLPTLFVISAFDDGK